jgi:hypothetical protein
VMIGNFRSVSVMTTLRQWPQRRPSVAAARGQMTPL